MNLIQGKIWGNTSTLLNKNNVEVHYLEIDKRSFCSKHKHNHKYNAFYVIDGEVRITVWKDNLEDSILLTKGQMTVVAPGNYHMFETYEYASLMIEMYWTEIESDDIIRETSGGYKT